MIYSVGRRPGLGLFYPVGLGPGLSGAGLGGSGSSLSSTNLALYSLNGRIRIQVNYTQICNPGSTLL